MKCQEVVCNYFVLLCIFLYVCLFIYMCYVLLLCFGANDFCIPFCRLVCSDAMARGMDVENVQYVILYDVPPVIKRYIHRVGRTARAGRSGTAITLLERKEV